MKRLFIILLSLVIFASCSSPAVLDVKDKPDSGSQPSDTTLKGEFANDEALEEKIVICDPFCDPFGDPLVPVSAGIDYDVLSEIAGIKCEGITILDDKLRLKMMAGDSDLDIIIVSPYFANSLLSMGIYHPIESEIIKNFNSSCFDYLKDYCLDENGKCAMMPIRMSTTAFIYPKACEEEIDFEKLKLYDTMLDYAVNYNGDRKIVAPGRTLFEIWELEYNYLYCDFDAQKADYKTDEYKKLYSMLSGWADANGNIQKNAGLSRGDMFEESADEVLLSVRAYHDLVTDAEYDFSEWGAVQLPRLNNSVDKYFCYGNFAFINPNCKNPDKALKVLETIAQNYFDVAQNYYDGSILFEDKSVYPAEYKADTDLFDVFYEITKNGFLAKSQLWSSRNDITEYQAGKIGIDEAIDMYQREIDIWLKE